MIKRLTLTPLLTAPAAPLSSFAQGGFKPLFHGKDLAVLGIANATGTRHLTGEAMGEAKNNLTGK